MEKEESDAALARIFDHLPFPICPIGSTNASSAAPVATAARAAGTGLVSMSTLPDIPGMLHLEREALSLIHI